MAALSLEILKMKTPLPWQAAIRCKSVADNLGSMDITWTDVQVDNQMVIMNAMRTMILKSDMVVVSQRVGRARFCGEDWVGMLRWL